ncbi:CubicO group peptidase (beta-lactamase class C family) [Neolewinella xylanilytica]|uniref:CubicO group peptidase (Beta-lactamase class C family) n=1 Tax=Neolewinella xylanilytica TaxID=1514080 RepID=A0A2S6I1A4_9BACT|nr:serine hydrolase domain-containing protein [Neolewinella xylanilytica]PPK84653.1 CubicO group peptidase (beta-lactamase class C family) [Neolewinella xylanilytica]
MRLLLPLLLFLTAPLNAQQDLQDSILSVLNKGIEGGAFPGGQVLVWHKGEPLVHVTAGYHTYDRLRPTRPDDVYDLASVTKTTSALLVLMKQYGEGDLDLDTPLGLLFTELKRTDKQRIPLRSALAHRAGLLPWVPYWQTTLRGHGRYPWQERWDAGRINDYRFRNRTIRRDSTGRFPIKLTDDLWLHRKFRERSIYRAIRKSPVKAPGDYVYSGLLFYLLPDYVERTTGMDYRTYLREHFYDPLGADELGYRPLDRGIPLDRIVPTEVDTFFRMDTLHGVVHDEGAAMMDGVSANAGLFSTAEDLAKLYQMLLNGGEYGGRRYLTQAAVDTFTSYQYPEEGSHRGLGFDKPLLTYDAASSSVAEAASPASFGHSGYTGTFVWADPEADLLYIFLSNRVHPSRDRRAIYTLNIRPRIHSLIYSFINRKEATSDLRGKRR